jgi:hypothetical protein
MRLLLLQGGEVIGERLESLTDQALIAAFGRLEDVVPVGHGGRLMAGEGLSVLEHAQDSIARVGAAVVPRQPCQIRGTAIGDVRDRAIAFAALAMTGSAKRPIQLRA